MSFSIVLTYQGNFDPPTAVTRLSITVRVKWYVGHSGRVDHSSVSELYACTCLLSSGLKYAILPHAVVEPLCILHGAASQVFQLMFIFSGNMLYFFCNSCRKHWFSSCSSRILFSLCLMFCLRCTITCSLAARCCFNS